MGTSKVFDRVSGTFGLRITKNNMCRHKRQAATEQDGRTHEIPKESAILKRKPQGTGERTDEIVAGQITGMPRKICPDCGTSITATNMSRHRRYHFSQAWTTGVTVRRKKRRRRRRRRRKRRRRRRRRRRNRNTTSL